MNNNEMWFGNRNHMQWVRCPEVSADYGSSGSQHSAKYLHGGSFNRQTFTAAKSYRLSWSRASAVEIAKVTDYVEGVWGEGPIYWNDPFTSHINALPQSLATPSIGARDGAVLSGGERPTLVTTSITGKNLPHESAVYTLDAATDVPVEFWTPVPPGYGVYFMAYGATTGTAGVQLAEVGFPWSNVSLNTPIAGAAEGGWVGLRLGGTGTLTLAGVMLKVLPLAEIPSATDQFFSGQGHSGCDFDGYPTKEMYSAAFDMVGLTAQFTEVGQWR